MNTELTKVAQKNGPEVELCEPMQRAQARVRLLKPDDFDAPELDLSDSHTALFALAEYWKGKYDKLKALTAAQPAQAERVAFERAMKDSWQMVDPLRPPAAGSYYAGEHAGICAALKTVRANFDRQWQARASLPTQPAQAVQVPEGFDVQALTATGGAHEYPLIVVRDKSSQLGEDVFQDEHPVIYGLLSAMLTAAQQGAEHG